LLWGITPVEAQATYGIAVDRLRGQIHAGLILPNEKLPPERQLADDIGISRVTLREALRVLETDKYIHVKRGALGGAFVSPIEVLQSLAVRRIARDLAAAMRVLEFRCANEAAIVRLAALRRGVPELKRLRAAHDSILKAATPDVLKQAETLFRLALGDAAHNPLLGAAVKQGHMEMFQPFVVQINENAAAPIYGRLLSAVESQHEDDATKAMADLHALEWQALRARANSNS
jgi:GntR family transcriptional regulator, transcriptional repressor for pyruvate dehydrogenase complex